MNDSSPSNEIQDDLVYMALYVHVNAGKKAGRIKKLTNPSIVQLLGGEVERGAEQKEESFFPVVCCNLKPFIFILLPAWPPLSREQPFVMVRIEV